MVPSAPQTKPRKRRARTVPVRRRPAQARAVETFEHLLQVSAALLEEVGWDGFNTNLVAERAGVSVRALYRYFPNKLAIVCELAERSVAEWDGWFEDLETDADAEDPAAAWEAAVDRYIAGVRAMPAGLAIRRAMAAHPELRAIDQADNERLADRFAQALRAWQPDLTPAQARARARVWIESANATIDLAFDAPPSEARALVRELKAVFGFALQGAARARRAGRR